MICICSSWWLCHPISSCSSKIQNGLPFWSRLTRVVLEKSPLTGCSRLAAVVVVLRIQLLLLLLLQFYSHYTGQPALVSNHRLNIDHVHIAQAFCRNVFLLGCCSRSSWIFLATVSNSWVLPWQFASLSSGEWQFLHTQIFYKAVYTATCLKKYQIFNYQFTENLMLSLLVK